tara:strand:- start:1548 stop:2327 length:780 start_codon:yes stop_codon:yes gene_type:complete
MARRTKLKRVIVTPDKHFPLHDVAAINVVCKAIEKVKPDIYVDLGDTGEWESVSHWQWKKKKRPPLEYQLPYVVKEIEEVNKGMDLIDASLDKAGCKERHITEGNHDDWLNRFVDENPYLEGYLFKDAVRLKQRGYTYHPAGQLFKIGHLYFYHGHHFAGINHTRNHLLRLGCNVMYGHHHDIQQSTVTHMDGPKSAWSIGCLKDMGASANVWLNNRQHNWQHAFAIVNFYDKGEFNVELCAIINGKTVVDGELIDGNA